MACYCSEYIPSVPSAHSAFALIQGKPGSGSTVVRDLIGRTAIIWLGLQAMRLIKRQPPKDSELVAIFGALAIELFVILHVNRESKNNGIATN